MKQTRLPPLLALLARLAPWLAVLVIVPIAMAENAATVHGLAPLPDDQKVAHHLLPPGAEDPDDGPSAVVYPVQQLTLRFNHSLHMGQIIGATCKTCHSAAYRSQSVTDSLIPSGQECDACHGTHHENLSAVKAGDDATGQCGFCHLGYKPSDGNAVAQLQLPRANLLFNHKAHVDRNIGCQQCHGAVEQLELATRDQLPRMLGCFKCHQMADSASQGNAKGACDTCHVRVGPGMKTSFASGTLLPPRWLHNAEHTPDFIERHKSVAADDSRFCANCHKEDFCTDCHDGRVRPRSVHPNDYLNMHPIEARMGTQKCQSCHREQSFCLNCHLQVGVAESSPAAAKDSARFHPPKNVWSDPPVKPGHHGFEAERNLNQCVSCHTERDCVVCHGATGVGAGFDPHRTGFVGGCANQFRRNPRPCFVCHEPSDGVLAQCR
jgi:hypothetical protein